MQHKVEMSSTERHISHFESVLFPCHYAAAIWQRLLNYCCVIENLLWGRGDWGIRGWGYRIATKI